MSVNLPGFVAFRRTVLELTGIDLDQYKSTQLERRLSTIMKRSAVGDLTEYGRLLRQSPEQVQAFKDFFTINVSEWLRNPEKFEELGTRVLPDLMAYRRPLRIWSAGCSNGSEPYSVAMLLAEMDPMEQHYLLATDLDEQILAQARAGRYQEKDVKNVTRLRRQRFLRQAGEGWEVTPALRSRVTFGRQNLLSDPFPEDLDLILCRNVVIYFTEEAKDELYRKFHKALRPDGVLFVGGTESLLKAREMGFVSSSPFFYRAVKERMAVLR